MASTDASAAATVRRKPQLSFRRLWSLGFGYPGDHIGVTGPDVSLSGMLETIGARVESLPTSG